MLSKLLKHEFKAMGRILLPLYAVTIIMSLVSGLSARFSSGFGSSVVSDYMQEKMPSSVALISNITALLTIVIFFLLVFVAMVLCVIFSISRYKNNLHGHQGYLMHTLPVTAFENVLSKVIVATAYQVLAVITAFCAIMFFTATVGELNLFKVGSEMFEVLSQLSASTGLTVFLFLVNWILGIVSFNTLVCASISIGHSFNGAKMLKSVGVFLLIAIAETYLLAVVMRIAGSFNWNISLSKVETAINLSLAVVMLRSLVRIGLFSWLSSYFIKNRLNLE